ncbi:hypothetical protein C0584_00440 [Candidatus Parcubacteria bacterium]|nr:MAG: hypothetical protein C0584_00440 [Candidatus Parcubacteria bacterium]
MSIEIENKNTRKVLIFLLGLLGLLILVYIIAFPIYPELKYRFIAEPTIEEQITETKRIVEEIKLEEKETIVSKGFPESEYKVSANRLIIAKIGVNAPIVETVNEEYGLSQGAWLMPEGAEPGESGNTIITGHRFKYLPPNNLTFYLFHKLAKGDLVYILWDGEEKYYKIEDIKVVEDSDKSILDQGDEEILTMFTCDPIYSTKERLVVVAKPNIN